MKFTRKYKPFTENRNNSLDLSYLGQRVKRFLFHLVIQIILFAFIEFKCKNVWDVFKMHLF